MLSRSFVPLGALFVLCALVAGCTGDEEPQSRPTPSATAPTTPAAVKLRFAVYGDESSVATYQAIANAYTVEHPEVTFEITSFSDASAAAEATLGAIATETNPPDVFLLDVDQLPDVVEADAVQPVNELLDARDIPFGDGIQRTGLTAFSANNELACMPNDVSPLVMFYNKRLVKPGRLVLEDGTRVESIDESWSWEAFMAAAEQAATRGAARGAYATHLPPDLSSLSPFILSAGGSIVDDNREPSQLELSDGATTDALKTLAALTRDRRLTLTPSATEATSPVELFKEGKLGILLGTRALVPSLREATGLRFDVAPIPTLDNFATISRMNGYCIAKTSEHIEEVADFIAFAVDGDGVKIASASGAIVPSSLDALHSPEFVQEGQQPSNSAVFAEGARRSSPTPYSTQWLAAAGSAAEVLRRVLYGVAIDVTSDDTPALDTLLELTDEQSKAIFNPPDPTETPAP